MRILLVASALGGIGPVAVAGRAQRAWFSVRPHDDVQIAPIAEGDVVAHVGTGLDEVMEYINPELSSLQLGDEPRRIWWSGRNEWTIDLANSLTWSGESDPRGSSDFLGADLDHLVMSGAHQIHVHVPTLMRHTDVGLGMLAHLAGQPVSTDPNELSLALLTARRRLAGVRMILTYPSAMALTGLSGVARHWEPKLGSRAALEAEREIGEIAHALEAAQAQISRKSLLAGSQPSTTSAYSGVGGGLGLMFDLLGAQVRPLGSFLTRRGQGLGDEPYDLVVYVGDTIGVDVPSGVQTCVELASQEAAPVVVIFDRAGLRKGELPRLGLNGAYELREDAYAEEETPIDALAMIPILLDEQVSRVARTWGWD
ncbi:glycerate kinase [Arcanobacterium wilhelmae]|uniref:Glycerate kinase n=1 Tax=Arcanobacterium wilhelmae TaxID=1803177 RepID=A0ABT9NAE5_9ACTO|nr:hypothetical protein [Arcanobacterium wilhelmae]MDP9800181.1 glycerate kinase [Arcanobacterium wilhelmae]WFN89622.1 hypothetical protein P8A24_05280 [Arcanobacterium wilhelmae]